ncbi:MAG TPA: hypothetical protein VF797_06625 [Noviherbaspirillum sp.]
MKREVHDTGTIIFIQAPSSTLSVVLARRSGKLDLFDPLLAADLQDL